MIQQIQSVAEEWERKLSRGIPSILPHYFPTCSRPRNDGFAWVSGRSFAEGQERFEIRTARASVRPVLRLIPVSDAAIDGARFAGCDASAEKIERDEVLLVGQILDREPG